jgi:hypothetical protein
MTDGSDRWQELDSLLDRVLDGIYDDADARRLNAILRDDPEARRRYVLYVELHGRLAWGEGLGAERDRETEAAAPLEIGVTAGKHPRQCDACDNVPFSSPLPPIVIDTSPGVPSSITPFGGFLFSYAVAAATVLIGLLIGWTYQVSISPQPFAQRNGPRSAPMDIEQAPGTVFVGQITGTFDCQWIDPKDAVSHPYVPLGRRFALASGLMEISYDTGARVILQGPCVYQVESRNGGYLKVGKLTASVGKKADGGRRDAEQSTDRDVSPLAPRPSSLFAVRTPTAVITDLGTEFGVEVDASGASQAHVFRGKVEMRAASGNSAAVPLAANQSGRVAAGKGQPAQVVQLARQAMFVREMPKLAPIVLFNTGVGLKAGEPDPHWQIVSRSDDPKFKPRAGIVRGMKPDDFFMTDDPSRSQWLSLLAGDRNFPEDVVFVFRTEFDLNEMLPSTAVLQGRFVADDRIVAIRLNGRRLSVPVHPEGGPFLDWTSFRVTSGFVKGKNVLEFDVLNANPYMSPIQRQTMQSRMSFRAELEGGATRDPYVVGDQPLDKTPRTSPPADKTAAIAPVMGSKVTVHGVHVILSVAKNLAWNRGLPEILRYAQNDSSLPARECLLEQDTARSEMRRRSFLQ